MGYGLTKNLPKPTYKGFREQKPSEEEFLRVVEEFWFEAYHVAKYLIRGDLWPVKFRDTWIKEHLLLRMIRWHEQTKRHFDYATHSIGKRMKSWVDKTTWEELHGCFAHFDAEDSWGAFLKTIQLFRRLATETAHLLGYKYPVEVDENIYGFIKEKWRASTMESTFETERTILRRISPDDLEPLSRLFADPEVMKYSLEGPYSFEKSKTILQTMMVNEEKYGFAARAVLHKKTGEFMGFCGLWWDEKDGKLRTDFGYRFFKKYWGKGFATESVKACLEYIAKKLPGVAIHAYIEPTHKASIRIAENLS